MQGGSGLHQLLHIKHGPLRDLLDEVVGGFFAEVEGFGETQDFTTQDTRRRRLGGVVAGVEAVDLGEAAAVAFPGDGLRAAFEDGVHDCGEEDDGAVHGEGSWESAS